MMRAALLAAVAMVAAAPAWALDEPQPCGTANPKDAHTTQDPRERCVDEREGQIVRVVGAPGSTLTIEFAKTERIFDVSVSDDQLLDPSASMQVSMRTGTGSDGTQDPNLQVWIPGGHDRPMNYVTLRPLRHLDAQPLSVLTTWQNPLTGHEEIRRHTMELSTRPGDLTAETPDTYYALRFRDPEGARLQAAADWRASHPPRAETEGRTAAARLQQANASSQVRNQAYQAMGTPADRDALAPVGAGPAYPAMWDDGQRTYLRYPGNRNPPNVWRVAPDGTADVLVGQSTVDDAPTHGHLLIVAGVYPRLRLREGNERILCIFNMHFDAVGRNPGTGTTSPDVQRIWSEPGHVGPQ